MKEHVIVVGSAVVVVRSVVAVVGSAAVVPQWIANQPLEDTPN